MLKILSVQDALYAAVTTARVQPEKAPAAPPGWIERAQTATDDGNEW